MKRSHPPMSLPKADRGSAQSSRGRRADIIPLGQPLRSEMEASLGHDFSDVRLHTGPDATAAANALGARAFTSGSDIVFAAGEYQPGTNEGRYLVAHELRHVAQDATARSTGPGVGRAGSPADRDAHAAAAAAVRGRAARAIPPGLGRAEVERFGRGDEDPIHRGVIEEYRFEHDLPLSGHDLFGEPLGPSEAEIKYGPLPRTDYVFIMGQDRPKTTNPFYAVALRYFRAHMPSAIFVTNLRTLADLLQYIGALHSPAGTIYIVSHANEDGTLSFGLSASDADGRTDANELRAALHPTTGSSSLPTVHGNIDADTTIQIKGCNIGQSQEMVELVDEAFGGAGTVIAPKYEQQFGHSPRRGEAERRRVERGIQAIADRDRPAARAMRDYEGRYIERAATWEGLSGPHIERPGTLLLTAAEIRANMDATFSAIPATERADFASRLGRLQHVETVRPFTFRVLLPLDPRAIAAFRSTFNEGGFSPRRLTAHTRSSSTPTQHTYSFVDAQGATFDVSVQEPAAAEVIANGRGQVSRPDNFAWTVSQQRDGDNVVFTAVGSRVLAELRHHPITDTAGQPFDPSTNDPRFFARSTFQPPPSQPSTTP